LTPVVPIVFHTGKKVWRKHRKLAGLLGGPQAFRKYAPSWRPLFLDLAGKTQAAARGLGLTADPTPLRFVQFGIDAMAPALLIAELARRHVARGASWGRIIGLTSGGRLGFPEEVSYGAAKAAQENYTMSAAVELGRYGITANMVHPPVTDTGWVTDAVRDAVAADPAMLRVATPAQVTEVIAYPASDAAALVTGNVITLR